MDDRIQIGLVGGLIGQHLQCALPAFVFGSLQKDRRVLERPDVSDMIEMQMGQQDCFDLAGLQFDLGQDFSRGFEIGELPAGHGTGGRKSRIDQKDLRAGTMARW